jgi:hypothetical protein
VRLVLKYTVENGRVRIFLDWRNTTVEVYVYSCENYTGDLKREVEYRGIKPKDPVAIIPCSTIENPLQLIQAALFYKVYSSRFKRFRNQGLLIAMLAMGLTQISSVVESIGREIESGSRYYLLGVDRVPSNTSMCSVINPIEGVNARTLKPLVKNTRLLISLL